METTPLSGDPSSLSLETRDDLKNDSSERLLDQLLVEYKKKGELNREEIRQEIQLIWKRLDSELLFRRWTKKLHEDRIGFNTPNRREARAHDGDALWLNNRIRYADWNHGNDDWKLLGTMLEHPGERARIPGFALGRFHGFQLALRINNYALCPLETDLSICNRLGVVTINPGGILGMRYISTTARTTKMLIAPLGKIFATKDTSLPASKRKWLDTEYVLVLEIGDDGRAASFVVVYDLTYRDEITGLGSRITVDAESKWPKLCGEWLKFTVARVDSQDSDVLKPAWGAHEEADLKLQVLSDATTEIVETGIKETTWAKGALPIGLYPLEGP